MLHHRGCRPNALLFAIQPNVSFLATSVYSGEVTVRRLHPAPARGPKSLGFSISASWVAMVAPLPSHDHWAGDVDSPHVQCRQRLSSVDLLTTLDNTTRVLGGPRTNTDIADCTGRTALMHAALEGWGDAFALMVDHGVNCAWTPSRDGKALHGQAKAN